MLNQLVLVGKVVESPVLNETNEGTKFARLLIEVERNFKNSDGEYEKDLVQCILWRGIAESAVDACFVGSLIGVKGRIQSNIIMSKDNKPFYNCEIIAEKISYLQTNGA